MMDGAAVREFADRLAKPQTLQVGKYAMAVLPNGVGSWTEASVVLMPPDAVRVFTLRGLVEYVKAVPALTYRIALSPTTAKVMGEIDAHNQRAVFAESDAAWTMTPFKFGNWMPLDECIVGLHHLFEQTEGRDELLRLFASVKAGRVSDREDDGLTQEVTVRAGVTLVNRRPIPNPVTLRPYRTFPEIAQPESLFVVRARGGEDEDDAVEAAIFEADGGAWRLIAVQRLAQFFRETLGNTSSTVVLG